MGLLTVGLVVGFGSADEDAPVIQAVEEAAPDTTTSDDDETAGPVVTAPAAARTETTTEIRPLYESAVGALEGLSPEPARPKQGVLSAAPEPPPTTAAPATTTTAPPETATTAADPATSETTVAETGETTTTMPGDTTVPPETTTTAAPANPEGYVDAGHGVFVPEVLLRIRRCESTDNYQAANPSSSARGAYQFLTGSWAAYGHAERYGVSQAHLASNAQQDEAALLTWQRDGTRPWNASQSCWNK